MARATKKPEVDLGIMNMTYVHTEPLLQDGPSLHTVRVYKLREDAIIPTYGTEESACFDLYSCFDDETFIKINESRNFQVVRRVGRGIYRRNIVLDAGDRALIPTGLVFDIPRGYKMLVYPRSGKSFSEGIIVGNNVGVIDSDYTGELFILIRNSSSSRVVIDNGERLAQGEIVPSYRTNFVETEERITSRTNRGSGGFGHTGNN